MVENSSEAENRIVRVCYVYNKIFLFCFGSSRFIYKSCFVFFRLLFFRASSRFSNYEGVIDFDLSAVCTSLLLPGAR